LSQSRREGIQCINETQTRDSSREQRDTALHIVTSEELLYHVKYIDRTAIMDLMLGDKGRNIGGAHAGLHKTVRKLGEKFSIFPCLTLRPPSVINSIGVNKIP
jgi:hypothetical protein